MRCQVNILIVALFIFALPVAATAAEMQGQGGRESMVQKSEHGEHAEMIRGMFMLGEQTVDGVKAMAHLQDVKVAMVRMGRMETHHFMVAFAGTATGEQITSGAVVLRINTPSGQEGKTVRLMAMEGYFGADITLAEKGAYTFTLDTKMGGPKRRQFEFKYKVK